MSEALVVFAKHSTGIPWLVVECRYVMSEALVVFAKHPEPGRVKTRLTPPFSREDAAALYRAFLDDALAGYQRLGLPVRLYLAARESSGGLGGHASDGMVGGGERAAGTARGSDEGTAQDAAGETTRTSAAQHAEGADPHRYVHPGSFVQQGDGLGEKMRRAFEQTFAVGYERVVIIGTDHPTLPPAFIQEAFTRLRSPETVVIGPTEDGGYYLLGMDAPRPALFRGMTYSHGDVFAQTVARGPSGRGSAEGALVLV